VTLVEGVNFHGQIMRGGNSVCEPEIIHKPTESAHNFALQETTCEVGLPPSGSHVRTEIRFSRAIARTTCRDERAGLPMFSHGIA